VGESKYNTLAQICRHTGEKNFLRVQICRHEKTSSGDRFVGIPGAKNFIWGHICRHTRGQKTSSGNRFVGIPEKLHPGILKNMLYEIIQVIT
jgi:hypothetical protein